MRGAFCSTAPIQAQGHGGGSSSYYELAALKQVCSLIDIIQPTGSLEAHYPGNAFMPDYECALGVHQEVDVAVYNGGPWSATLRVLGAQLNIVDCPAHNLALSIEEWEKHGGPYPFKHMSDPDLFKVYSRFLRECDVIITQARMSIGWLADLGIDPGKCVVVPGGCHYPQSIPPMPDEFGVGYLGALGTDKGVNYLLQAWLAQGVKGGQLVLAGQDTDKVAEQVTRLNSTAKAVGMGRVPDITDFWKQVTVYVQPSVTEGFGLPVLEALSYGRPVIVTENTGAAELIDEGIDGFVVPIRRPDVIVEALEWFRKNPGKAYEMGSAGRKKAKSYTWERAQKEYERIIRGV